MTITIWLIYTISVGSIQPLANSPEFYNQTDCQAQLAIVQSQFWQKVVCWPKNKEIDLTNSHHMKGGW